MPAFYRFIALAMAAVVATTGVMTVGCASPPTPTSMAADAAAKAAAAPATPTSATAGNQTIVAIQPAAPPAKQCTLCGFLGLDKIGAGIGGLFQRAFSRIKSALGLEGRFPGLQPKPPILPITDPANMGPDAPPAVKAAAAAKMEEDQSGQKIQALRYLATIGCGGCYPGIEEAMLAALDDCTEAVRYEALLALRGNGNVCCAYCRCQSCCSPAVRKKCDALANERDDSGCYREPSERVRRMARVVLSACGGLVATRETAPSEGPTPAPPPDGAVPTAAIGNSPQETTLVPPAVQLVSFEENVRERSAHDAVLARVNGEDILESRLLPLVESEVAERRARGEIISPEQFEAALDRQVRRAIDAKLLLHRARTELTAAGRSFGKLTADEVDQWLKETLNVDSYVSLAEMNAYYRDHADRFRGEPEVRWEQVTIWVKDAPSREKALAVADLLRRRAGGEAVASTDADLRIAETKVVDYTPYDRIDSPIFLRSLKSLSVGVLSPVIEHHDELYLLRVIDRRPGKPQSFDEAVNVIRKELLAERRLQAEQSLLGELRNHATIWTLRSSAAASSSPISATGASTRKQTRPSLSLSPPTPIPAAAAPQRLPNIVPRRVAPLSTTDAIQQASSVQSPGASQVVHPKFESSTGESSPPIPGHGPPAFRNAAAQRLEMTLLPPTGTAPSQTPTVERPPVTPSSAPLFESPRQP